MAVLLDTGFESTDYRDCGIGQLTGTASIQTTTKRSGAGALKVNPTTTGTGYVILVPASSAGLNASFGTTNPLWGRFYFRIATAPSSGSEEIACWQKGPSTYPSLRVNSDRTLAVYAADGTTLISTGTAVLATDRWHRIEYLITSGTDQPIKVLVDGVTDIDTTWTNTSGTLNQFILGKRTNRNNNSVEFYYDDVIVTSDGIDSPPGPGMSLALYVNGAGTYSEWSLAGNYLSVDDIGASGASDGNTTLVQTQTNGERFSVAHASVAASGGGGVPQAVTVVTLCLSTTTNTVSMQMGVLSGTSTALVSSHTARTTYGYSISNAGGNSWRRHFSLNDPATSSAWTTAGVDAAQPYMICLESAPLACSMMILYVALGTGAGSVSATLGCSATGEIVSGGGTVWTGSGSVALEAAATGAGALAAAGAGSVALDLEAAAAGALAAAGAGSVALDLEAAAAGAVVAAGAGAVALAVEVAATGDLVSGGTVWTGSGSVALASEATAAGSLLARGSGSVSLTTAASATGALVAAGVGSVALTTVASATGALVAAGAGSMALAAGAAATGHLAASGSGSAALSLGAEAAAGGLIVTGSGSVALVTLAEATGGGVWRGLAAAALVVAAVGAGSIVASGSGAATLALATSASGALVAGGAASLDLALDLDASGHLVIGPDAGQGATVEAATRGATLVAAGRGAVVLAVDAEVAAVAAERGATVAAAGRGAILVARTRGATVPSEEV